MKPRGEVEAGERGGGGWGCGGMVGIKCRPVYLNNNKTFLKSFLCGLEVKMINQFWGQIAKVRKCFSLS